MSQDSVMIDLTFTDSDSDMKSEYDSHVIEDRWQSVDADDCISPTKSISDQPQSYGSIYHPAVSDVVDNTAYSGSFRSREVSRTVSPEPDTYLPTRSCAVSLMNSPSDVTDPLNTAGTGRPRKRKFDESTHCTPSKSSSTSSSSQPSVKAFRKISHFLKPSKIQVRSPVTKIGYSPSSMLYGPAAGQSEAFVEAISSDEGENIDDSAPFSIVPASLQQDNDLEITKVITRNANDTRSGYREINRVKGSSGPNITFTCVAGKCVELKDGSFMRIKNIVEDRAQNTWLIGQVFLRHNEFKDDDELNPDSKWPRRHNEVVLMSTVKSGHRKELVRRSLQQVTRNRILILTNHSYPEVSSKRHVDSYLDVHDDKKFGPLFCRWKQTHVFDVNGKIVEESIQRLPFTAADNETRIEDTRARFAWRQCHTIAGGEHTHFRTHMTENGHGLEEEEQVYSFGDTFSGAGGASCGADQAGLFVKFGVDFNGKAMKTYKSNFAHKGAKCLLMDIHNFILSIPHGYMVDVLHISPPCQPFSAAHTIANIINDEMNEAALFAVGELLRKLKPRVVTLEETYGLFNRHREWFNALIKMFVEVGYSIRWTCAKLEEYGLPQKRRRLLIIAAGPGETLPPFPAITHSATDKTLKPLNTIHDAITNIPRKSSVSYHNIGAAMYERGQQKSPYSVHTQAKTITTSGGIGNHHPSGLRTFTIREFAALQMFPLTYRFADVGVTALRRQIGNAVPPFIFKKVYREIINSLKRTDGLL